MIKITSMAGFYKLFEITVVLGLFLMSAIFTISIGLGSVAFLDLAAGTEFGGHVVA